MDSIKILVLFTFNTSLQEWKELGFINRELHMYQKLKKHDFQVGFVTYGNNDTEQKIAREHKIDLVYSFARRRKFLLFISYIMSFFAWPIVIGPRIKQYHVIKTNQVWGGWLAVILGLLWRKKVIVRAGYEKLQLQKRLGKRFFSLAFIWFLSWISYRFCDLVFISSDEMKDFISRTYKIPKSKIVVLNNGIDVKEFRPLNFGSKRNVLYVGRLSEEKNIDLLIRAMEGLGVALDIIGDGPQKCYLAQLASDLDVTVNFLGSIENSRLTGWYNSRRVFVLLSEREGCPKGLLEAMACGMTVVGADVDGINNIIVHGNNGLLCSRCVHDVRSKLVAALSRGSSSLGVNATSTVRAKYSMERIASLEAREIRILLKDEKESGKRE